MTEPPTILHSNGMHISLHEYYIYHKKNILGFTQMFNKK